MRRQHKDTTTTLQLHSSSSSIALLQERFRQLQRVKEMREEKELQKVGLGLATSPSPSPDPHASAARPLWICHPDLIRQVSADPGSASISTSAAAVGVRYLGISSVNFVAEGSGSGSGYGSATAGSVSRCSGSSSIQNLKKTCSDPHDVDTSLHL